MQDFSSFIASHLGLAYAFSAALLLLFVVEMLRARKMTFRISTSQAIDLINRENAAVIDIRSNDLYRKGHILNAVSIPSGDIQKGSPRLEKLKQKPVILACQMGAESQKLAANLLKQGYNAYSLNGGTRGWSGANLPISKD